MIDPVTSEFVFQFIAGSLCLDFINTVGGNRQNVPKELLHSYNDLLKWSAQAGLVVPKERVQLERLAALHPRTAAAVFERGIALREAEYRVFRGLIRNEALRVGDLRVLNDELAKAMTHARLAVDGGGFRWAWEVPTESLDYPLWPVVRSAAELMTHAEFLSHLHQCDSETCGWLFLDTTKNHSRRWCSMKDCGNLAKVRRHRERQKSAD